MWTRHFYLAMALLLLSEHGAYPDLLDGLSFVSETLDTLIGPEGSSSSQQDIRDDSFARQEFGSKSGAKHSAEAERKSKSDVVSGEVRHEAEKTHLTENEKLQQEMKSSHAEIVMRMEREEAERAAGHRMEAVRERQEQKPNADGQKQSEDGQSGIGMNSLGAQDVGSPKSDFTASAGNQMGEFSARSFAGDTPEKSQPFPGQREVVKARDQEPNMFEMRDDLLPEEETFISADTSSRRLTDAATVRRARQVAAAPASTGSESKRDFGEFLDLQSLPSAAHPSADQASIKQVESSLKASGLNKEGMDDSKQQSGDMGSSQSVAAGGVSASSQADNKPSMASRGEMHVQGTSASEGTSAKEVALEGRRTPETASALETLATFLQQRSKGSGDQGKVASDASSLLGTESRHVTGEIKPEVVQHLVGLASDSKTLTADQATALVGGRQQQEQARPQSVLDQTVIQAKKTEQVVPQMSEQARPQSVLDQAVIQAKKIEQVAPQMLPSGQKFEPIVNSIAQDSVPLDEPISQSRQNLMAMVRNKQREGGPSGDQLSNKNLQEMIKPAQETNAADSKVISLQGAAKGSAASSGDFLKAGDSKAESGVLKTPESSLQRSDQMSLTGSGVASASHDNAKEQPTGDAAHTNDVIILREKIGNDVIDVTAHNVETNKLSEEAVGSPLIVQNFHLTPDAKTSGSGSGTVAAAEGSSGKEGSAAAATSDSHLARNELDLFRIQEEEARSLNLDTAGGQDGVDGPEAHVESSPGEGGHLPLGKIVAVSGEVFVPNFDKLKFAGGSITRSGDLRELPLFIQVGTVQIGSQEKILSHRSRSLEPSRSEGAILSKGRKVRTERHPQLPEVEREDGRQEVVEEDDSDRSQPQMKVEKKKGHHKKHGERGEGHGRGDARIERGDRPERRAALGQREIKKDEHLEIADPRMPDHMINLNRAIHMERPEVVSYDNSWMQGFVPEVEPQQRSSEVAVEQKAEQHRTRKKQEQTSD